MTPLRPANPAIDELDEPRARGRKPVRGSLIWWLRFLGLVAFVVVLSRLSPAAPNMQLTRLDPRWLGLCMLLTIIQLVLDAFVWQQLLAIQRLRHPFPKTLISYLASQYLGSVTPGHVGEFLAAGYISSETGITFGYALSSVVMKKLLHWAAMIGFGIWALPLLVELTVKQGAQRMLLLSIAALALLSAGIAMWVVSLRRLAHKWQRLSPWQIDTAEFWFGMRRLLCPQLAGVLAVSAVSFSLLFFQLDAALRALGIILPITLVGQVVALSRMGARLAPFSVFGWGSKDAGVIALLSQHGIDPAVGLMATLLLLVTSYLVTLLLSGLCWWMKPLILHRAGRSR